MGWVDTSRAEMREWRTWPGSGPGRSFPKAMRAFVMRSEGSYVSNWVFLPGLIEYVCGVVQVE